MELTISYKTDAELAHDAVMYARWKRDPDDPHSVTLSLLDFLRTGMLGPIHLGMARAAVLDSWLPRRDMPLHEVEEQLTLQGIGYQRTLRPSDPPDMMIIQLTSGVELGFQSPDEAVFGLESITWRRRRER